MTWIPPVIAVWEKISSSSRILTKLYSRPYLQVIQNEIHLAKITQQDVILNIGCGAIPFTALYLAALTGARVYALDNDARAVCRASHCVNKAGLSQYIKVIEGDGAVPVDMQFTSALVALQAAPKKSILESIRRSAPPGARFIFRLPSSKYRQQYDNLLTSQQAEGLVIQPMRTFDRSVLYVNQ